MMVQKLLGPGIVCLLSGNGHGYLHRRKEVLDCGSFLVINQGSEFSMRLTQTDTHPFFLFFHKSIFHRQAEGLSLLERRHPKRGILGERLEWLAKLGNSCSSFTAIKADSIIRSIQEELMVQARSASEMAGRLQVARQATRVELFKRLSLTREWIQDNYAAPITLHDMAGIALLNSQHFLRMFRQCYQVTPHRYLIGLRLEQAKRRLLGSRDPIAAICQDTGFESNSSFSGLFKQRFGAAPSVFRDTRK